MKTTFQTALVGTLLVTMFLPKPGAAQTFIPGGEITSQTWTLAGSPYVIQGDLSIVRFAVLTIQAGVVVEFESTDAMVGGNDPLRVEVILDTGGAMQTMGTQVQPIVFEGHAASGPSVWSGIDFRGAAGASSLVHCQITDAGTALRSAIGPNLVLQDVTLDDSGVDLELTNPVAPLLSGTLTASRVMGTLAIPAGVTLHHNGEAGFVQGDLGLLSGATYEASLQSMLAFDQLAVTGSVTLGAALSLDASALAASSGQTFVLVDNDGTDPVVGTFLGLPEGSSFSADGWDFDVTYSGNTGNDVVLTVSPTAGPTDLTVVKTAPSTVTAAEGGISYGITVVNNGPAPAVAVVVTDQLPPHLITTSITSSHGTCSETAGVVTCSLGDLGVGAQVDIEIVAELEDLPYVNTVSVSSSNEELVPQDNSDTVTTTLLLAPTSVAAPPVATAARVRVWNVPNPFNPRTRIYMSAVKGSEAKLVIYDAAGRKVQSLGQRVRGGESTMFEWDGRDSVGQPVASGVYYYLAKVDGREVGSSKGILVR